MARIVVMEDDAGTRALVIGVLHKSGHHVAQADNGADGLALVVKHTPDLIISDVQMPQLNGFEVVSAVRANPAVAHIPIILLTSLDDRANMRAGMLHGADDYIPKPCQALELSQAVSAQLARAAQRAGAVQTQIDTQVGVQVEAALYAGRSSQELAKNWPQAAASEPTDRSYSMASVVCLTLQNLHAFSAALTPDQISQITRHLYSSSSSSMRLLGATHVQFVGENLLAIYADDSPTAATANHFTRAAQAALNMAPAVAQCKQFVAQQFADYALPPLQIGINIHAGPVSLTALPDPMRTGGAHIVPVGDTVTNVMRLRDGDLPILWPVMTTQAFLHAAPELLRIGVAERIGLQGGTEVDVYAVVGPGANLAADLAT